MYVVNNSGRFSTFLIIMGIITTGIIIYLASIPKKWEKVATSNPDGSYSLTDDWVGTIDRKIEQYDNQQLYVLTAIRDGYYYCKHCPTGKFFLKEYEVYKYGITGIGPKDRGYSENWLSKKGLNYTVLTTGHLTVLKSQETTLIGAYAILPENVDRPLLGNQKAKLNWYRLVIPPGNNSLE